MVAHLAAFLLWVMVNVRWMAFDPFPFGILTLIVSSEGVPRHRGCAGARVPVTWAP